ncbi:MULTISPECIES: RIP metalloprotease RseP [Bosea]|jgi:regulator of sigma E protease|uniref:RIP metalloprotease RseP n=1 Tax=Bosea TaxID=85413 RepID=UPI0021500E27|nr:MULTISPECIES: RIP metalloprotease RseP [Bosea]MCR4521842.1 RIP metalloprotease RseP [Bosea sp. 47.2.35]MDR6827365.1 regulator of sigma E protease [Bosea robiniae]MDR6894075.1 regulator of sigma E protease [Bosea sp. BE109]MDR7137470.1 regulator of sigma E protease [Bosea sp. BE168]MDR7174170.1 regulator of sigma E protease [Bosea sp. BE271]
MEFAASLWNAGQFVLGYLLPFLFVLTIVVFVHELGHFLVGRWCGVDVKTFSIGFGRELFGFNDRHGTRWRFALIPLGGYVKFSGDADASSAPDDAAVSRMSAQERERSFPAQSLGERAAIVAAGPIANFLLAILIFAGSAFFFGKQVLIPRVDVVVAGGAAEKAGLKAGDIVIAIDGQKVTSFSDMQRIVSTRPEERLEVSVERDGGTVTLPVTPALTELKTQLGIQRIGVIGVRASPRPEDVKIQRFGLLDSTKAGFVETWFVVTRTYDYIAKLVTGRESTDQLSGPIRIAQVSGIVASNGGLLGLINLAAILSVSIGLMNLVPVPMLDGGHLLFYLYEALRGRPLSPRAQEIGFRVGLALVLMLMLFVTWNDIVHVRGML